MTDQEEASGSLALTGSAMFAKNIDTLWGGEEASRSHITGQCQLRAAPL